MASVAVILSGCGVFDGAEIHEAVFTLYGLDKRAIEYQCFAPDIEQLHVINHLTGEVDSTQSRNVLVESARIARGNVKDVKTLDVDKFDALVVPGGFGAAKNLCNFALVGPDSKVTPDVLSACQAFAKAGKPAAYACIAPALISNVYGPGVELTIGNDPDTAKALASMGAVHKPANVADVIYDQAHQVLSTPAYMLAGSISEAANSIDNMIAKLAELLS